MSENPDAVTIVLVEDDPGHARLIEKNLRRNNIRNDIIKFENGQHVVDFLYGSGERPASILMLLDLNLPGLSGYQVLQRMKEDPSTRSIPVIVLTTTDDYREVQKCYDLGCNVYITKPIDYENFSDAIRKIGLFLSVVQFPGAYA